VRLWEHSRWSRSSLCLAFYATCASGLRKCFDRDFIHIAKLPATSTPCMIMAMNKKKQQLVRMTVWLEKEQKAAIRKIAKIHERRQSEIVRACIDMGLPNL
jgi:hypothetical protein